MSVKDKNSKMALIKDQKNLTRRYLIWCYKTTKEDLDRVNRYFTQKPVDEFILSELIKTDQSNGEYVKKVDEFAHYMDKKFNKACQSKYSNVDQEILTIDYQYLQNRLDAIEKAIVNFLGEDELEKVINLYEEEMTSRILQAREHT